MNKFFSNLFGEKGGSSKKPASVDVITTAAAQPHVLREKMKEKKLTHGETVTASVSPVRLEIVLDKKMALYFCPMKTLEVSETLVPGDGDDIPALVNVELKVPADLLPGLYSLKNVKLSSNGVMQVTATSKTTWEKVEPLVTL